MPLGIDIGEFRKRFDTTEALQREMLEQLKLTNRLLAHHLEAIYATGGYAPPINTKLDIDKALWG